MAKPAGNSMDIRPNFIPQQDIKVPQEEGQYPNLKLLQAISPELTKGDDKYIPGAEAGNLLIKGDGIQRMIDGDEGLQVITLSTRKRYVEWIPRKSGGGFVAEYTSKEEAESKRDPVNDLVVTYDFLCIEPGVAEPIPFLITFDSPTKMGVAKKWAGYFAQYKSVDGVIYKIGSKSAKNKAGQNYFNFSLSPLGWADEAQFKFSQQLIASVEQAFLPEPANSEI